MLVYQTTRTQLEHFQQRCRALQLPEGLMLRYNLSTSLYFYLHTAIAEGKIKTRIYASDSPYERKKTDIGEVATPMFESQADQNHLRRLEKLLLSWVNFIKDAPDEEEPFTSFPVGEKQD